MFSHKPELSAIAFQLLAALDGYEQDIEKLARERWDPELYTSASELFDEMRLYVGTLPALSVPWIEVLITRFELAEALWQTRAAPRSVGVLRLVGSHREAIARLRMRCKQLIAKP